MKSSEKELKSLPKSSKKQQELIDKLAGFMLDVFFEHYNRGTLDILLKQIPPKRSK